MRTIDPIAGGGYRAEFSPLGGGVDRLTHIATGAELLRTPKSEEERKTNVFLFGNPILFPPNRIRGGRFMFIGREYVFPVNEESTGCHIHGALYGLPFREIERRENAVRLLFQAKEGEYLGFPHAFSVAREYELNEHGLIEHTVISNESETPMPTMLAYHTTIPLPFLPDTEAEDYTLRLAVGREQIRNEFYLPTGEWREGERETQLRAGEFTPAGKKISALLEGTGTAVLEHRSGVRLCYDADPIFRYRLLWRSAEANFLVIEPQTCAIDCFHIAGKAEGNGLIVLPPHTSHTFTTRLGLKF